MVPVRVLESEQKGIPKRIQGMRDIPYEARMKLLNLHSLERRRLRANLIKVCRWYRGYNRRDINKVLGISSQNRKRNNEFKLEKSRFRKVMIRN